MIANDITSCHRPNDNNVNNYRSLFAFNNEQTQYRICLICTQNNKRK